MPFVKATEYPKNLTPPFYPDLIETIRSAQMLQKFFRNKFHGLYQFKNKVDLLLDPLRLFNIKVLECPPIKYNLSLFHKVNLNVNNSKLKTLQISHINKCKREKLSPYRELLIKVPTKKYTPKKTAISSTDQMCTCNLCDWIM